MEHYNAKLLMNGIWQITDYSDGLHPTVDMYLIEGTDRALLIDAGDSESDLKEFVSKITSKPVDLCITHGHGDHAMAFSQFERVYMSHKDIDILKSLFHMDIDETMVHDLQGGEVFDLGNSKIEVIALPGHTFGSMVLLDSDRQLLFTSDGLGSGGLWMQFSHCTSIETYGNNVRNLEERLEPMNDLKLFVGHDCQRGLDYGKEYIRDMRILAEMIVSGDIIGKPTENPEDFFGGLSVSYGLISELIYKPNNILTKREN